MVESKTYLNVPYAQKDAAKALGAKWDAANKKWYVPADKDIALFTQWQVVNIDSAAVSTTAGVTKPTGSVDKPGLGAITQPTDKNFVAYRGDEPPWD